MGNGKDVSLGATVLGGGRCRFKVWAPFAKLVEVHLLSPKDRVEALVPGERGYHEVALAGVRPGARYRYRLDGKEEWPDPASRHQPEGPHGPSEVVDPGAFAWRDAGWRGIPLDRYVFYEIHVGTFTPEGTLDAVVPRLPALADLGVTAVELMPVAQFPGNRNWGYDGTYPYAVQNGYGGPEALRRLVDACHAHGLAVVLDVVYNHLGPEGNYTGKFGPFLTEAYKTPWGPAMNYDGADSEEVRRFFVENALHWIAEHHIDGLRLDAIHGILDFSADPFLGVLGDAVRAKGAELGREAFLFPESDLNDVRVLRSREAAGLGLDAQWSDDFHHALHTLLTGERQGYYRDFGHIGQLATAHAENFVYSGQYSEHRRRRHGNSARGISPCRFVVSAQNHDQVGNRMQGERLSRLVDFESLKLAAGVLLLSPFLPLLFMGEEYGEEAPFLYFVSHTDPALIEAVRRGRAAEFGDARYANESPDPQAEETFLRSKLRWEARDGGRHRVLLGYYRELIRLRRTIPALARLSGEGMEVRVHEAQRVLEVDRRADGSRTTAVYHFGDAPATVAIDDASAPARVLLDSSDERWGGSRREGARDLPAGWGHLRDLPPRSLLLLGRDGTP